MTLSKLFLSWLMLLYKLSKVIKFLIFKAWYIDTQGKTLINLEI